MIRHTGALLRRIVAFVVALLYLSSAVHADEHRPKIALIIDDLGYERVAGERAIALPGPVAFAVLPHTPRGAFLAEKAHAAGKDVLLHLPLQAERDHEAVPGSLLLDMTEHQFSQAFTKSIDAVPFVVGVNNHRGSLLTRHPGHMTWLMNEILSREDLFFVDSYTTAESIALNIALESGVPAVRRDVFLDPDQAPETLAREFSRLKKLARRKGFAVGIAHPYKTTLAFLESALPTLEADGFELITISELVLLRTDSVAGK